MSFSPFIVNRPPVNAPDGHTYWAMCRAGHVTCVTGHRDYKGWGACGYWPRHGMRQCRWTQQTLPFQKQLWAAWALGGWDAMLPLIDVDKLRRQGKIMRRSVL